MENLSLLYLGKGNKRGKKFIDQCFFNRDEIEGHVEFTSVGNLRTMAYCEGPCAPLEHWK